ncbi:MAG TPA: valine--tRNA ligase [Verrucomicrobiae bacterium]|jgi:valyl-tRNA synthetase|nr:valine--tRNA ligase [Verrucomicrobiae bacterium]
MPEISKAYEPQSVESKWYQFWLDGKFFVADAASKKPAYSIVIPPPNVTGVLTLGHVLNNTIQDILARKARMDGKEVLWLPGTDHAGIATQTVVDRALKKEGKIRHRDDLGREKFLEKVWEWKEKHGGIIIEQLKRLGASCDWSRQRFTMDEAYSRCVQKVFVDLYKKGLIYRGKRMVNWDPSVQTSLSDEEVIMKPQNGALYYFKVEVAEIPGTFLTIATTRPETIPGDTAVAVNPKDPRYSQLIGKHVLRPLPAEYPREQKLIPIIGDEHVDFEFGTGILKVTPAHDKADFEIGQRHKLPIIEAINADGSMSDAAGADLKGLDRFKARKVAVEKLKEIGAWEKEEPYTNNVGFSERADVPIEPRLSEQWFLKYPSTEKSRAVVAKGEMTFHPDRWAKVYDHWMGNIQDWCISRQLWWGHRIPVWNKHFTNEEEYWGGEGTVQDELQDFLTLHSDPDLPTHNGDGMLVKRFLWDNAPEKGLLNYPDKNGGGFTVFIGAGAEIIPSLSGVDYPLVEKLEEAGFTQDPDVLDTWFSSWLWPFATMGWPSETETLKRFYPTTDLVTGPDIIFFWVARMIMAGYEFMGEMPFRNVYFTGIIRDKQGRKMSKSLGNSPDPLDLIAKFGADALRFGVMRSAPLGQDILFDEQHVELGRNFCNKLWNACRFRQMQAGSAGFPIQGEIVPQMLTTDDKWILLKLDHAIQELTQSLAEYKFSEAAQTLYRFFWSEYCDWYVEATKAVFQGTDDARKANTLAVIDFVLSHTLRLFHPFLPFITEELWHGMGYAEDMPEGQGGRTIMFAPWPKPFDEDFRGHYGLDDCYLEMTDLKYELVTLGRNLRREANIASNKKVKFILKPAAHVTPHDAAVLKILLNAEALEIDPNYSPKKGTAAINASYGDLYLPLEGLVDVATEKARLTKELEKYNAEIQKVEGKLNNPAFTQKVPPQVLEEHKQRLADWQAKKQHVLAALAALEG